MFFENIIAVIKHIHQSTLPAPYDAILLSIIFGSKASPVPYSIQDDFRRAGVIHTLVVSGQQVSLILGLCATIFKSFKLPLPLNFLLSTAANLTFMIMTGAGASIVRSSIMAEIALVGMLIDRQRDAIISLFVSAVIMLIINYEYLFDIGFQLSFLATWALIYLAPKIEKIIKSPILAVSLAPIIATTPIIAYNFCQINIISIISNIIIVPIVEVLVLLGFITTILGAMFLPFAQILNYSNLMILKGLLLFVQFFANIPFSQMFVSQFSFVWVICYFAVLFLILRRSSAKLIILVVICAFSWSFASGSSTSLRQNELKVTFFDVGQGDSILVQTPSHKNMLIDAGSRYVSTYLHKLGVKTLDLVILTHPHADHICGIDRIIREINIKEIIDNGTIYESYYYKNYMNLLKENKIKLLTGAYGQVIDFGDGAVGTILKGNINSTTNNNSVVLRLVYGDVSFLFTGDTEREGEENMLERGLNLKSDILKVGHHGSSTSTSQPFLDAVVPRTAVISVGAGNKFYHPNTPTISRLRTAGIEIFRTDQRGTITVKTDGEKYTVECAK